MKSELTLNISIKMQVNHTEDANLDDLSTFFFKEIKQTLLDESLKRVSLINYEIEHLSDKDEIEEHNEENL